VYNEDDDDVTAQQQRQQRQNVGYEAKRAAGKNINAYSQLVN